MRMIIFAAGLLIVGAGSASACLQSLGLLPGLQNSMGDPAPSPGMLPGIVPQSPPQAIGGLLSDQSQVQPQGQSQGPIGYIPPPAPHINAIGNVLDQLFTGGAVNSARMQNYQHMVQQQGIAYNAQAFGQEYNFILHTQGPQAAAMFAADPQGFLATALKGQEGANIPGGDTRYSPMAGLFGGPQTFTAPKLQYNPDTGQSFTQGVGGPTAMAQPTTPTAEVDPATGAIVNSMGQVTGSVAVPQKLGCRHDQQPVGRDLSLRQVRAHHERKPSRNRDCSRAGL